MVKAIAVVVLMALATAQAQQLITLGPQGQFAPANLQTRGFLPTGFNHGSPVQAIVLPSGAFNSGSSLVGNFAQGPASFQVPASAFLRTVAVVPAAGAQFQAPVQTVGVVQAAPVVQTVAAVPAAPVVRTVPAPLIRTAPATTFQVAPAPVIRTVPAPIQVKAPEPPAAPAQYQFSYDVNAAETGDQKHHEESRNGDDVQGSYSVVEPDGTLRTVKYTADAVNGFNAVVERTPGAAAPVPAPVPRVAKPAIVVPVAAAPKPFIFTNVAAPAKAPAPVAVVAKPVAQTKPAPLLSVFNAPRPVAVQTVQPAVVTEQQEQVENNVVLVQVPQNGFGGYPYYSAGLVGNNNFGYPYYSNQIVALNGAHQLVARNGDVQGATLTGINGLNGAQLVTLNGSGAQSLVLSH